MKTAPLYPPLNATHQRTNGSRGAWHHTWNLRLASDMLTAPLPELLASAACLISPASAVRLSCCTACSSAWPQGEGVTAAEERAVMPHRPLALLSGRAPASSMCVTAQVSSSVTAMLMRCPMKCLCPRSTALFYMIWKVLTRPEETLGGSSGPPTEACSALAVSSICFCKCLASLACISWSSCHMLSACGQCSKMLGSADHCHACKQGVPQRQASQHQQ